MRVERLGMRLMGLMLAGPTVARGAGGGSPTTTSRTARFRFMDHRAMDVGGVPALVNRISYTGDLGYEVWVEPAYLRTLYRAVKAAGEPEGIVDFGMRALLVDAAGEELADLVRRASADLRAVRGRHGALRAPRQDRFVGREAAAREAGEGPRLRRVSLVIDAENADVMGDEPIWARTDRGLGQRRRRRTASARRASTPPAPRCREPTPRATATGGWSAG